MRIVVHGQQAFGKAVLEALLKRGENVIAVYVAPEKEGARADPLKEAALDLGYVDAATFDRVVDPRIMLGSELRHVPGH